MRITERVQISVAYELQLKHGRVSWWKTIQKTDLFFASHNCMCHYNKITTSTNSEVKILYKIPRCQFGQPLPHRKVTAGFYYITFHWRIDPDCIHHLCVPRINPGNTSNPRWFTSVVKALKKCSCGHLNYSVCWKTLQFKKMSQAPIK